MNVPIVDLGREYREIRRQLDPVLRRIFTSGGYILGQEGEAFEKELARYCGVGFAVGVNSGTDAILIALMALGIGPGDEVLVPAMTFIATAEPVALLGARPVFVDIENPSYGMDPKLLEQRLTPRTKAIIAVHLYGQPASLDPLIRLAANRNIPLVEDMAQAIGSTYKGKMVGSFGRISCVSFFPTKNLGACGDGGAVLTSDPALHERVRALRNHGAKIKYHHDFVGLNSRLDEIQAAVLRLKLARLNIWNEKRAKWAKAYNVAFKDLPVKLPETAPERKHIYHLYSIRSTRRDELKSFLEKNGIPSGLHYPAPLHLQPAFASWGGRAGDFPESEALAAETLSLPLFPHMTAREHRQVVKAVRSFFGK
jgi:dTDP-4-amino-4,6-dideoxygalactose transaminase